MKTKRQGNQSPFIKNKYGKHIGESRADHVWKNSEKFALRRCAEGVPKQGVHCSQRWMNPWRIESRDGGTWYCVTSSKHDFHGHFSTFKDAEDALALHVARDVITFVRDRDDGWFYPCLRKGYRRISGKAYDITTIRKAFADPKHCRELLLCACEVSDETICKDTTWRKRRGTFYAKGWSVLKQRVGWLLLRHGEPYGPALFACRKQALDKAREAIVREHFCIDSLDGGKSATIVWKTSGPFGSKVAWEGFADGLAAEAFLHRHVKGFFALIARGFWPDKDVHRIPLHDARRTGPSHREDSVKPASFRKTFGFQEVEFGLWINQADRQRMLDMTWDGFMDLADILGVSPRALSLGGQLSLAFGIRGNGTVSTHCEYDRLVINMTKPHGAGCLAHEWFHAFDHYLARVAGLASNVRYPLGNGGTSYVVPSDRSVCYSDLSEHSGESRLPSTFTFCWHRLKTSIYRSGFLQSSFTSNAWMLDGMRVTYDGFYWSKASELLARAFEAFVEDEIERLGQVSEFLVNGTHETICGVSPYPEDGQRNEINNAMYEFMQCTMELLCLDATKECPRRLAKLGEMSGYPC